MVLRYKQNRVSNKIEQQLLVLLACLIYISCDPLNALSETETYDGVLSRNRPAVIDLGARTCIPCRMMAPILKKLERQYRGKADVIFIDVIKHPDAVQKFGIRIIPTQIFYDKNFVEVARHEGFMDETAITRKLDLLLQANKDHEAIKAAMIGDVDSDWVGDPKVQIILVVVVLFLLVVTGLVMVRIFRNFKRY